MTTISAAATTSTPVKTIGVPILRGERADGRRDQLARDGGAQQQAHHPAALLARRGADRPGDATRPEQRPEPAEQEAADVQTRDPLGEALDSAEHPDAREPDEQRGTGVEARDEPAGRDRQEHGSRGVGGHEDAGRGVGEVDGRAVGLDQRGQDVAGEALHEQDGAREEQHPPRHSATVRRGRGPRRVIEGPTAGQISPCTFARNAGSILIRVVSNSGRYSDSCR